MANGWPSPKLLAETTKARGPNGWIGGKGDPFFAMIAEKDRHNRACRESMPSPRRWMDLLAEDQLDGSNKYGELW